MDEAKTLAIESSLSSVSVQAVASAADVMTGGFLHHIPSRQALIDAIFREIIAPSSDSIDQQVSPTLKRKGPALIGPVELRVQGPE